MSPEPAPRQPINDIVAPDVWPSEEAVSDAYQEYRDMAAMVPSRRSQ